MVGRTSREGWLGPEGPLRVGKMSSGLRDGPPLYGGVVPAIGIDRLPAPIVCITFVYFNASIRLVAFLPTRSSMLQAKELR
jgi:hypothetical protein